MTELTTYQRMQKVFNHEEPDGVPIIDLFWGSTIERWKNEGMGDNNDVIDYFGLDKIVMLSLDEIDTSPRFPEYVVEETDTYKIEQDRWGITKKNFKPVSSTFQHLNHEVVDKDSWLKAKKRMSPAKDRINWNKLINNYEQWRKDGAWIQAGPWCGFDIVNARMCDTETILYAMYDDPEWVADMCNTQTDLALALCQMLFVEGYPFDELLWFDDMAYRNGMLFSKKMWKEIVMPYQKRIIDWAHNHDIKVHLHCCGDIRELVPDLIELGLDMLNPLEVKANMEPLTIKKQYGDRLALRGGFDVRKWTNSEEVEEDIRTKLPELMKSGGYVFASDHSVPDSVSSDIYQHIVHIVKKVGVY